MMNTSEISIAKIIMLLGIVITILYSLYLGMENVALTALGIIGGYIAKDMENNKNNNDTEEENGGV